MFYVPRDDGSCLRGVSGRKMTRQWRVVLSNRATLVAADPRGPAFEGVAADCEIGREERLLLMIRLATSGEGA